MELALDFGSEALPPSFSGSWKPKAQASIHSFFFGRNIWICCSVVVGLG